MAFRIDRGGKHREEVAPARQESSLHHEIAHPSGGGVDDDAVEAADIVVVAVLQADMVETVDRATNLSSFQVAQSRGHDVSIHADFISNGGANGPASVVSSERKGQGLERRQPAGEAQNR